MSKVYSKNETAQEEPYNILGESLTNLTWLQHLNVSSILAPCEKYEDNEEKKQSFDKISSVKLPSSSEIREYLVDKSKKPPYSYIVLIGLAFRNMKCDRLSVEQISEYVTKYFPYFEMMNIGDYIRHTLQHNKLFERVRKRKDEPYRGIFWRMSDSVVIKCDSDHDEDQGSDFVVKKKRSSADNFRFEGSEDFTNKKFMSRSTDYSGDYDYNFGDCSFFGDYNWDTLMNENEGDAKSGKFNDDWFPSYDIPEMSDKSIYDLQNSHLPNFIGTNCGFEDFEDPKIIYNSLYGYGDIPGVTDLTSAIQFDPLLSTTWSSSNSQDLNHEGLPRNKGYGFNMDGV